MRLPVVNIQYHQEADGSWWAESPDVPGFTAVGDTWNEIRELAREGVRFAVNQDVIVRDGTETPAPANVGGWVNSTSKGIASFGVSFAAPVYRSRFPRVREAIPA